MPRDTSQFDKRNQAVRTYIGSREKRYPHWKMEKHLSDAASKFFLSVRTIEAIIKFEGIYAA